MLKNYIILLMTLKLYIERIILGNNDSDNYIQTETILK